VFGVSTDTLFTLAEFSKVNAFQVELLSDHDAAVAADYDCKFNADFGPMKYDRIAKRGSFLINTDGIVTYAEVLSNPGNMPDLEAIQAAIGNLK
jgi:peroxiredoxin